MNLQNGYKKIYEKTADGKRTFYATKNNVCDPAVDDKIVEATIGEYKLIYEKDGRFYGSTSGIPTEADACFEGFDKVFKVDAPAEEPKTEEPKDEEPAVETPAKEPGDETEEPVEGEE